MIWRTGAFLARIVDQGPIPAIHGVGGWRAFDLLLSNRIFKSYNDIVVHCRHGWNTLIDQPWKIMSTGLRDRAHIGQSL